MENTIVHESGQYYCGQYLLGENAGQEWYLKIQKVLESIKVTRKASLKLQASSMNMPAKTMVMKKQETLRTRVLLALVNNCNPLWILKPWV